jgi:UrcA family protein
MVAKRARLQNQKGIEMRFLLIGLAASLALSAPLHASATTSVEVRIPHGDLDLSKADGVSKLKKRSVVAIRKACAKVPVEFIYPAYSEQRCRADAEFDAMKQINQLHHTQLALADKRGR